MVFFLMTKSIHVVADGKISFFSMAEWCPIVCKYISHIFFIYSSVYRQISCLPILAIVIMVYFYSWCLENFEVQLFLGLISNIFLSFSVINCTASQFTCVSNGQCISKTYRQDGVFDCDDHWMRQIVVGAPYT